MRKVRFTPLVSLLTVSVITAASAYAVTDGSLDGDRHPYVGLMVAQDTTGKPLWRCSGTLLSSRLFLTAGHCTEAPAARVEIWFNTDVESGIPDNGYPSTGDTGGTPYTHPDYNTNAFFLHELGVVVLDTPMVMQEYGTLPELNVLDMMTKRRGKQNTTFTAVGYGLQESFPDKASFLEHNTRVRMFASPHLLQINTPGFTSDFSLLLSNNHATGGTCFGDSGGPNFIDSSTVIGGGCDILWHER